MTKPKLTLTVTDPQGHKHTRKTHRAYEYVVFTPVLQHHIDEWKEGQQKWPNQEYYTRSLAYAAEHKWFAPTWHGRHDLAVKEAAKFPGSVIKEV